MEPSYADNCGSLSDCFKQSKTAAIAVAMTALLASLLLDFSPIGYAKGLLEAVIGKDILTGDKLAWWQRVLNLVPGGKGARTAAKAVDEIGDIAKAVDKVTDAAKVGEELGDTAKTVDKITDVTYKFDSKIKKQLDKRGWSKDSVQDTITNPYQTKPTRDIRRSTLPDGSEIRMDDSATAYINKDGSYVVRNDRTGGIVQISNRNNPNWKSSF